MKLKPGCIIQTKEGIYIVLEKEQGSDSYRCIRTQYKEFKDVSFEEILKEDILGHTEE